MSSNRLPVEVLDQIFVIACSILPVCPRLRELYGGMIGVADTATTTDLMCVCRHFYHLLAPLLYRAPLLAYPRQIARLDWTLEHNPSLAPLIEHIHMKDHAIFMNCSESPWYFDDRKSKFGVIPGTEFPLHSAIETDAVELGALCGAFIDPTGQAYANGKCAPFDHWMDGILAVRSFIAWLRCVAAYGAKHAVQSSDMPLLEARAHRAAELLREEYRTAAVEEDKKFETKLYRRRVCAISARTGTRFGPDAIPDIGAEMPALYAHHYDAYSELYAVRQRWLRLTVARALAYGRLKGAANAQAYEEFLAADHRWVWRGRDEAAEPWTAEFRDEPDEYVCSMPFDIDIPMWYSMIPGTRLSPRPLATDFDIVRVAISRILAKATSVRTVACPSAMWLDDPALVDALPQLNKLIVDDNPLPSGTARGPLSRVVVMANKCPVALQHLRDATRRGHTLGQLKWYTRISHDGLVSVKRRILDTLTPAHVDLGVLGDTASRRSVDPLTRATGIAPELTEYESEFLNALSMPLQDESDIEDDEFYEKYASADDQTHADALDELRWKKANKRSELLYLLEWMRAAH